MGSLEFLETMLMYYLPGLNVSSLSEAEFVMRMRHLIKIREMESDKSE